jgi:DNA-directed RNA polymerase subunit RPC12/RpoP
VPKLACHGCGRQIYTVAPLEALFAEERRCPRCGAHLLSERRETDRRQEVRRINPPDDPGPPSDMGERRTADRRRGRRRTVDSGWGRA